MTIFKRSVLNMGLKPVNIFTRPLPDYMHTVPLHSPEVGGGCKHEDYSSFNILKQVVMFYRFPLIHQLSKTTVKQ